MFRFGKHPSLFVLSARFLVSDEDAISVDEAFRNVASPLIFLSL